MRMGFFFETWNFRLRASRWNWNTQLFRKFQKWNQGGSQEPNTYYHRLLSLAINTSWIDIYITNIQHIKVEVGLVSWFDWNRTEASKASSLGSDNVYIWIYRSDNDYIYPDLSTHVGWISRYPAGCSMSNIFNLEYLQSWIYVAIGHWLVGQSTCFHLSWKNLPPFFQKKTAEECMMNGNNVLAPPQTQIVQPTR